MSCGSAAPAEAEAVEAMIGDHVAGRLPADTAAAVEAAIAAAPALAAFVAEVRAGQAWIEQELVPEAERLMARPASPTTMDFVQQLVAGAAPEIPTVAPPATLPIVAPAQPTASLAPPAEVVSFPRRTLPPMPAAWRPWLMAASVAAVLLAGAGMTLAQLTSQLQTV